MIVSGPTIQVMLEDTQVRDKSAPLFLEAESVVVYRSSPGQKAQVVNFMRKYTGDQVTLAIGDGANDINMIQSAHVGIGIMGKEGNQAASFSDYAVLKFRDLRRLLFWHGRNFTIKYYEYIYLSLFKSWNMGIAKFSV